MEGRKPIEEIIRSLDRILARQASHPRKRARAKARITILTMAEIEDWLEQEPSFPKPITKPLSDDGYHPNPSDEDLTEPRALNNRKNVITHQDGAFFWCWLELVL